MRARPQDGVHRSAELRHSPPRRLLPPPQVHPCPWGVPLIPVHGFNHRFTWGQGRRSLPRVAAGESPQWGTQMPQHGWMGARQRGGKARPRRRAAGRSQGRGRSPPSKGVGGAATRAPEGAGALEPGRGGAASETSGSVEGGGESAKTPPGGARWPLGRRPTIGNCAAAGRAATRAQPRRRRRRRRRRPRRATAGSCS
jgi:hypothetical protein